MTSWRGRAAAGLSTAAAGPGRHHGPPSRAHSLSPRRDPERAGRQQLRQERGVLRHMDPSLAGYPIRGHGSGSERERGTAPARARRPSRTGMRGLMSLVHRAARSVRAAVPPGEEPRGHCHRRCPWPAVPPCRHRHRTATPAIYPVYFTCAADFEYLRLSIRSLTAHAGGTVRRIYVYEDRQSSAHGRTESRAAERHRPAGRVSHDASADVVGRRDAAPQ